jgi:hypothetical protein
MYIRRYLAAATVATALVGGGITSASAAAAAASHRDAAAPVGAPTAASASRHGKCSARSFLYKDTIRGTHFITASSDAWCNQKQRKFNVHVALWRKRWYGWQLLEDSDIHGKNRTSNYAIVDYKCKAGSTYTWKMQAWVTVDGGNLSPYPLGHDKRMTC